MNPATRFTNLTIDQRATAIEQAATSRGVNPIIMEKDFWVSWLLGVLFSESDLRPHIVFKGGTSLSKVYQIIERFSEDVDLSISPAFVGVDVDAFEKIASRNRRDKAMKAMQKLCCEKAKEEIAPILEQTITRHLGEHPQGRWLSYEEDQQSQSPVIYFHYPGATPTGLDYIRRNVKLELGSLTDQQPVDHHTIRPWVADEFPEVFDDWQCEVVALDISRTFWEKITILHCEFHRPEELPTPDRYARHYYDVSRLLTYRNAQAFLADQALAARVADWKSKLFTREWARYDTARHGSLKLAPPEARRAALKRDYESMRPLFLKEPPKFEEVIRQLIDAEEKINSIAGR